MTTIEIGNTVLFDAKYLMPQHATICSTSDDGETVSYLRADGLFCTCRACRSHNAEWRRLNCNGKTVYHQGQIVRLRETGQWRMVYQGNGNRLALTPLDHVDVQWHYVDELDKQIP